MIKNINIVHHSNFNHNIKQNQSDGNIKNNKLY